MKAEEQKPRGGRPATGAGRPLNVRLYHDALTPLDAWIAAQPEPKPSRPEAVSLILKDWFIGHGLVRHREDPEGAN